MNWSDIMRPNPPEKTEGHVYRNGRCWLFDKEERMRKAATYFAQLRITDATAEETV